MMEFRKKKKTTKKTEKEEVEVKHQTCRFSMYTKQYKIRLLLKHFMILNRPISICNATEDKKLND